MPAWERATVWATDKTGTLNGASSTSVPLPSLTPSTSGELYFGYSLVANTAAAGAPQASPSP